MTTRIDTLAFAEKLKAGGFSEMQARAATEAFAQATGQELVTKGDLDQSIAQAKLDIVRWTAILPLGQAGLITALDKLL